MKTQGSLVVLVVFLCLGCSSHYAYRASTNECNCEEYRVQGKKHPVDYVFRARYRMDPGIVTTIEIDFINRGNDSLLLHPGSVRVSSRNVAYQYNDRFVPLPFMVVPPGEWERVSLTGRDIAGEEDWHKIAGERMRITVKGIRLGELRLPETSVEFVPENPKLTQ